MKINIQNKAEQAPITLSNLKLFEAFSIDELKDFLESSKCEIREFSKDEITHFQNETCRFMEIILEGRVLVQNIDEDGNVLTIETFVNGDIIGANLIFSSKHL